MAKKFKDLTMKSGKTVDQYTKMFEMQTDEVPKLASETQAKVPKLATQSGYTVNSSNYYDIGTSYYQKSTDTAIKDLYSFWTMKHPLAATSSTGVARPQRPAPKSLKELYRLPKACKRRAAAEQARGQAMKADVETFANQYSIYSMPVDHTNSWTGFGDAEAAQPGVGACQAAGTATGGSDPKTEASMWAAADFKSMMDGFNVAMGDLTYKKSK